MHKYTYTVRVFGVCVCVCVCVCVYTCMCVCLYVGHYFACVCMSFVLFYYLLHTLWCCVTHVQRTPLKAGAVLPVRTPQTSSPLSTSATVESSLTLDPAPGGT